MYKVISYCRILLLILGLLLSQSASAAVEWDLQDILENLRDLLGPMITLLLVISYTAGIGLIFRGLGLLKAFGMPLTQMTRHGEIAGPIVYLVVGAALIYLPETIRQTTYTFFGSDATTVIGDSLNLQALGTASDELLAYVPVAIEDQWADLVDTIILYIQFVGFLAFIRGWFIVAQAGQPGVQPGSITKGITHIVGGVIAINFIPTIQILRNTIFS